MGSLCTHASGWYKGNPSLCAHLVCLQLQCVQETNPQGGSYSTGGSSGSAAGAPPITQPPPIGEALSNTIDLLVAGATAPQQQQPPLELPVILPVPPLQPAQAHTPPAQPVAAPQVDTPPLADAATVEPSSSEASSGDGDGADSNAGTDGDSSSCSV